MLGLVDEFPLVAEVQVSSAAQSVPEAAPRRGLTLD